MPATGRCGYFFGEKRPPIKGRVWGLNPFACYASPKSNNLLEFIISLYHCLVKRKHANGL